MVVVEGGAPMECPVMKAWLDLPAVVDRATKGKICLVREAEITRTTVADNYELLMPLISEFGLLAVCFGTL